MATFIKSVDELEAHFSKYKSGYLFRGQVKHYLDSNGFTSIPTSFSRHGCIPDVMFKWMHCAKAMIRGFTGVDYFNIDLELSQAILQHYGWRSFYVDLTKCLPRLKRGSSLFLLFKYQLSRQGLSLINLMESLQRSLRTHSGHQIL